ncbi:MAG: radical SAM protein [Deltaproteobacteria bacterium]|nr:radical SAM protein [Deltaproteobacteria bacterium]
MDIGSNIALMKAAAGILHGRRTFGGPLHVILSFTGRCNVRCIHCYFHSDYAERPNVIQVRHARMHNQPPPDHESIRGLQRLDWDADVMRSITDQLIRMGTKTFILTGGEPFLSPHLLPLTARLKRAGKYCLINTNGTLIDRTATDELIRLGCDELRVSVLAGTEETYDRVHPGISAGTFGRLKRTLEYIAERKAARLAASVGADQAIFRPVDDVGDPGLSRMIPSPGEAALARTQLAEAAVFLESRRIRHNIPLFLNVFERRLDTSALYRIIPCYYGWVWTRIDPDGLVYPCCRCYEPMGNAFEQPFPAIWNGVPYRRFRERAIRLNREGARPESCNCDSCSHFTGNLRIYSALHPFAHGKLNEISPDLKVHV